MRPYLGVLTALCLAGSALALSACGPKVWGPAGPVSEARWLSLTESSYAAVDNLIHEAGPDLNPAMGPLVVTTLSDIDRLETSSPLGRMIAEQASARFTELGYPVSEIRLREELNVHQRGSQADRNGEFMLSRSPSALREVVGAGAVLAGTYAVAKNSIFVNMRLIRVGDGKVLAAHDYSLVMTPDIAALTRTDDTSHDYQFFSTGWARD